MLRRLWFLCMVICCAMLWAQSVERSSLEAATLDVATVSDEVNIGSIAIREIDEIAPEEEPRSVYHRMNVQGYLTDNNGNPINGNVPMTFSIWNAYTAGTKLWGYEYDTVYCSNGLFNYLIGGKKPITPIVFSCIVANGSYRTLQITVYSTTMPRIPIGSVGFAYMAGKSDSTTWAYNSDKLEGYHGGTYGANIYPRTDAYGKLNSAVLPAVSTAYADSAGGARRVGGRTPGNSSGNVAINNGSLCSTLNADMLDGRHSGNSSGNVAINNGTLCSTLNADKLEGYHGGTYGANIYPRTDAYGRLNTAVIPPVSTAYADSAGGARRVGGRTPGNSSGNVAVNNGYLCSNLNADMLDGYSCNNLPYLGENGGTMYSTLYMQGAGVTYRASDGTSRGYMRASDYYDQLNIATANGAFLYLCYNSISEWRLCAHSTGVQVHGTFTLVDGDQYFVQPHPYDNNKEIAYSCLEGGESGAYCRGSAQLTNGAATVQLPDHFAIVTSEHNITVQVTPLGECNGLYVERKTVKEIVVRELGGGRGTVRFDYLVQGVRRGYENRPVIRDKTTPNKGIE